LDAPDTRAQISDVAGVSEEVVRSLAGKLKSYLAGLSEEECALFQHILVTALPPHLRLNFTANEELLSEADRNLLDRFSRK